MDNVDPPTVKVSDAKGHASLLSNFLLENLLYFGVNEIINCQTLLGNFNKMTVVNSGMQHRRSLDSYFKSSWDYLYLFGVISYISYHLYCLNSLYVYLKLIILMFSYSLNNTTTLCHVIEWTRNIPTPLAKDNPQTTKGLSLVGSVLCYFYVAVFCAWGAPPPLGEGASSLFSIHLALAWLAFCR